MFGAVDAALLLELAHRQGYREQLELDLPPVAYIDPEYCTDVPVDIFLDGVGSLSFVDHPSFAALRKALHAKGYISVDLNCSNGDRVLKPFYLNQVLFQPGDRFVSAAAMRYQLRTGKYLTHQQRYPPHNTQQKNSH